MQALRHLSITARGIILLGVICLGSLGSALYQSGEVARLNESYRVIAEERSPGYVSLARAQRHFQMVARHLNRMVIEDGNVTAQASLWREVEAELRNFHTRNNQFERGDPGQRAVAEANRARIAELERHAVAVRDALLAGRREAAVEIIRRQVDATVDGMRDALVVQVDGNVGTQSRMASEARSLAEAAIRNGWIALALVVLLGTAALVLLFVLGVARPLGRLTDVAEQLSRGEAQGKSDDSASLSDRQDEVGRLARAIRGLSERAAQARAEEAATQERAAAERAALQRQAMASMAARVESETQDAVRQVNASMGDVSGVALRLREGAARVSQQSEGVAGAAAEALEATQIVVMATEQLSASIRSVTRQLQASSESSREAVSGVEAGVATIGGLQEAVSRIGEVARLIGEIAGQTNLLALNATIEAARAGEAGKGFAVVAGEVKALATLTAQRTGDIAQQIGTIEVVTREAVAVIGRIATSVGTLDRSANAMAEAMEQQSAATEDIARSVAGAATSVRNVEARIVDVATEARSSGDAAVAVQTAAEAAQGSVQELQRSLVRIVRSSADAVEEPAPMRRVG
ncbi:methyl-accepting chemotaxis protein [Sediminicoccus sp. KRV36]|uniref:methyl-accepting chemotaxis protein n=1 Tax=Sediminicoccus sp. KRV36 TaxID=3133721 RepID=UPI00200EC72C|nr:methyl-accepting chemotaxis protein [Sediminicoccus rosea]UPY36561.1 methyl-accepting chemotaxis protein [Sediminicoccus rosea]